jgi:hypothetical protein
MVKIVQRTKNPFEVAKRVFGQERAFETLAAGMPRGSYRDVFTAFSKALS